VALRSLRFHWRGRVVSDHGPPRARGPRGNHSPGHVRVDGSEVAGLLQGVGSIDRAATGTQRDEM
jgi:hypothetical protein